VPRSEIEEYGGAGKLILEQLTAALEFAPHEIAQRVTLDMTVSVDLRMSEWIHRVVGGTGAYLQDSDDR
jgi:hypothetical protein